MYIQMFKRTYITITYKETNADISKCIDIYLYAFFSSYSSKSDFFNPFELKNSIIPPFFVMLELLCWPH